MNKIILPTIFIILLFAGCKSSIVDDPSISIRYEVPEHSFAKVTVINNYNTIVITLADKEDKLPGIYQVTFNANNLAEGLYYYTVELNGIESNYHSKITKYLLLVK